MIDLEQLRREIFYLAYHLHWAHEDILGLATDERRAFLELLNEQLQREQQSVNQASNGGAPRA